MSREILILVDSLAREKSLDVNVVYESVEAALASAMRRQLDEEGADVVVKIDRSTGEFSGFRRWLVVPDEAGLQEPDRQEIYSDAQEIQPGIQVGEYIVEPLGAAEVGRIGAQVARQAIMQRIRDAEREQILEEFLQRGEEIFSGTVKRLDRGDVILESGRVEARLPRSEMLPRENLRNGDRVRAYITSVDRESRSQPIIVSRTAPEFVRALFENEVPEIEQGLLEIKAVSREPGLRSKIAVVAYDKRIDPIGTCVGMRGSRVMEVRKEIGEEMIDIVLWDDEPAQFVISALAPAIVESILVDVDRHSMDVVVDEENLPKAIGTRGQNVRLASELTGWQINILTPEQSKQRQEQENQRLSQLFVEQLDVDAEIAEILIDEGFSSLEEVAYVPVEELLSIDGFDEDLVNELRNRARNSLLVQAIETEEKLEEAPDLREFEELTPTLIAELFDRGIRSRDDLADLATDELVEYTGLEPEVAAELISKARAHWFEDGAEDSTSK
ncbi:transcription termination factor NusA [Oligella urethralis]|uniref:transcription termination factor NusA n=1 Tax=Oligella urethralis TaxID=90245 RepID=UPI00066102B7|nr:transcription termination factor NusA [Oligella urethralis]